MNSRLPLSHEDAFWLEQNFNSCFQDMYPNINVQFPPTWGGRYIARDYTISLSEKQDYLCQQFELEEGIVLETQCEKVYDFFKAARLKYVDTKAPVVVRSAICLCGIDRRDCDYHR